MARNESLSTAQVMRAAGVGRETLRFYERKGLLPKVPRTDAGYRIYPADVADQIHFIKTAQDAGFTLKEIKELLSYRNARAATCGTMSRILEKKLAVLTEELALLKRRHSSMRRLARICGSRAATSSCEAFSAAMK